MSETKSRRPASDEFNPYYYTYIKRVPDGNVVDILARQMEACRGELGDIPAERTNFRYAEGKWSLKEVWGHVVDIERVFT